MCTSVYGVGFWNGLGDKLKQSLNIDLRKYTKSLYWQVYNGERLCWGGVHIYFVTLGGYLDCR